MDSSMQPNTNFREASELKPGDVILCYCNTNKDLIAKAIHNVTASEYCHAAIYYGDSIVVESTAKDGIKKGKIGKVSISDLLSRYEHVAVLRQPDAWASDDSVAALKIFSDKVIENEAKYNTKGIISFKSEKALHESNVYKKLDDFFSGQQNSPQFEKGSYFCSEFVCDCYIAVGFIDPSAAVVYSSKTYSPGDLGKDPTFGTFWGYLTSKSNYTVPESDYFYRASTYDAIFGT